MTIALVVVAVLITVDLLIGIEFIRFVNRLNLKHFGLLAIPAFVTLGYAVTVVGAIPLVLCLFIAAPPIRFALLGFNLKQQAFSISKYYDQNGFAMILAIVSVPCVVALILISQSFY